MESKLHLYIAASENIQDLLEEDTSNRWKRHNPISSAALDLCTYKFSSASSSYKLEHTRVEDAERMQDWYKKRISEN